MFQVTLTETVNSYYEYTRDDVLDLMAMQFGMVQADIRAEYEALDDDALELAFLSELRQGCNETTDTVWRDMERYSDVQSTNFSVTLDA